MGLPRFTCPGEGNKELSPNLYVANRGPAVGISFELIASVFGRYGQVKGVYPADESGTRVIVCFDGERSSESAMKALDGLPCPDFGGRSLHILCSVHTSRPVQENDSIAVSLTDSELEVPGVYLLHDFLTVQEEEELLAAVDSRPWNHLC